MVNVRSDFEIVSNPRTHAERVKAIQLVEANPEAFSGVAHSGERQNAKREKDELTRAFAEVLIHQFERLYSLGGIQASGAAWAAAYADTLDNFDSIADQHNYNEYQRERGREILTELQEISDKKLNNRASEADMHNEKSLFSEGESVIPEAMQSLKTKALEFDNPNAYTFEEIAPQMLESDARTTDIKVSTLGF